MTDISFDKTEKEVSAPCGAKDIAASRLERLGTLSERLIDTLGEALSDTAQFNRFIVAEKSKNRDGDPVTENVEKIFGKVDFKSVKDAASAICTVADSVRSALAAGESRSGDEETDDASVTVRFESGREFAE